MDGETSQKLKKVPNETNKIFGLGSTQMKEDLKTLKGKIRTEKPNSNIYEVRSTMTLRGIQKRNKKEYEEVIKIKADNVIMRGSKVTVQNEHVLGIVL